MMINKLLIMMISFSIIFSQQTHTFTDEEMVYVDRMSNLRTWEETITRGEEGEEE